MASPQKENGYTAIANEILDAVALLKVNGTQFKTIIAVWRNTYGFHRKDHEMSLAYIARAIGVDKMQARRAIDGLIKMNVLVENAKPTFKSGRVISFNKDHETWLSTNESTVDQLHYTTVDQTDYSTVDQLDYQQRKTKDNSKDRCSKYNKSFIEFYSMYPKKLGKEAAKKSWEKLKPDESLYQEIMTALSNQKKSEQWTKDNGKFIPYPATWLNGRRWEDEIETKKVGGDEIPWI